MQRNLWRTVLSLSLVPVGLLALGGCGKETPQAEQPKGKQVQVAEATKDKKVDDHSGWWCDEHGIPEAECSMCSAKVAAECKKKGDWCEKHDRAKSQCFFCKPERREYYAAKYRAKYGKEPPSIEEFDEKKGDDKSKQEEKKQPG